MFGAHRVARPRFHGRHRAQYHRRIRIPHPQESEANRIIADTLQRSGYLTIFDLVQPEFRGPKEDVVFDNILPQFSSYLDRPRGVGIPDASRQTFLRLSKHLHDMLYTGNTSYWQMSRGEHINERAEHIRAVLYFLGKTLSITNARYSP
jgi:adenylate cyclase